MRFWLSGLASSADVMNSRRHGGSQNEYPSRADSHCALVDYVLPGCAARFLVCLSKGSGAGQA